MSLFQWSRPAAIAGLVIAGRIRPTIERLSQRTLAHVFQKRFEVIQPAVTNCNTESMMPFFRGTPAAFSHVFPSLVGWRSRSRRMSVFQSVPTAEVGAMAAAPCCVGSEQIVDLNGALASAITSAKPKSFVVLNVREAQCCQKSETLICNIQSRGHSGIIRQGTA